MIPTIDPQTLKDWLESGEAVLLDVREPGEYASAHIAGAALHPLGQLKDNAPDLRPGQRLVVHCQKGGRGQSACQILRDQFPAVEIYNLDGGLAAWAAAGLPVATGTRRVLPLDRQVQLTIGLVLLSASILGTLYGPAWFILTGLIGAGLTVAGTTGFCGLARVMARMSWNRG